VGTQPTFNSLPLWLKRAMAFNSPQPIVRAGTPASSTSPSPWPSSSPMGAPPEIRPGTGSATRHSERANISSLVTMRRWSGIARLARLELQVERRHQLENLLTLDAEIDALTRQRLEALERLHALRNQLWPVAPDHKGRRPPATETPPLPPMQPNALGVGGRSLRSLCRAILRRHGPSSLFTIHTWIHHYGYEVEGPTPVKALADALGYETRAGRTARVRRGVYALDENRAQTGRGSTASAEPPLVDPVWASDPLE